MLKKLLYTIFTTTAILSWSLLAHANCPAVPTNGSTLKLTTGANCSYNASDFMGKNIIITGDGDISINGDIDFTSGSNLTISSPTAKVTFEDTVTVSGGSITNNGIIEFKKDYEQTSGVLTNNNAIKGKNISFSVTGGSLNLNNGSDVLIDNKTATSKTITFNGNIGSGINFNTGSSFSVSGVM